MAAIVYHKLRKAVPFVVRPEEVILLRDPDTGSQDSRLLKDSKTLYINSLQILGGTSAIYLATHENPKPKTPKKQSGASVDPSNEELGVNNDKESQQKIKPVTLCVKRINLPPSLVTRCVGCFTSCTNYDPLLIHQQDDGKWDNPLPYKKILEEIECLKRSQGHNNVIKLVDYFIANNGKSVYIVTEFGVCDIWSLAFRRRISPVAIFYIMLPMLKALEHLHSRGVVHLDIKEENIVLTSDGVTKLIDFGLSVMLPSAYKNDRSPTMINNRTSKGKSKRYRSSARSTDYDEALNTDNNNGIEGDNWIDYDEHFALELQDQNFGSEFYTPPELVRDERFNGTADVWSWGVTVMSLFRESESPFGNTWFELVSLYKNGYLNQQERLSESTRDHQLFESLDISTNYYEQDPPEELNLKKIVIAALEMDQMKRLTAQQLLAHEALKPVIRTFKINAPLAIEELKVYYDDWLEKKEPIGKPQRLANPFWGMATFIVDF